MKLTSFKIYRYRSILESEIHFPQYTVLLGKNNEGKSNIARALNCAMSLLESHSRGMTHPRMLQDIYNWDTDFPVQLKDTVKNQTTSFRLVFKLDSEELKDFQHEVGSTINGIIPISITIKRDLQLVIEVTKQGKNTTKTLKEKSPEVSDFIASRISVNYIPAIRNTEIIKSIIRRSIDERLRALEDNDEYANAKRVIEKLQQSELDKLATGISPALKEYLPSIKSVELKLPGNPRRRPMLRNYSPSDIIIIDDGIKTDIENKGDGVISLAAIALLKENALKTATPLIIIEEPETHLHPKALHQLNELIKDLSIHNQVIVTIHNPVFIIRNEIDHNIIVNNGAAKHAKSIKEICEVLGIEIADNLVNSKYVLLVEGLSDKRILEHLLPLMSTKIKKAINQNLLVIYPLHGATNLNYTAGVFQSMLCTCFALVDDDASGSNALTNAQDKGNITVKNSFKSKCPELKDSEIENCIYEQIYSDAINEVYGIDISSGPNRKKRKSMKWSNGIKNVFNTSGKSWSEKLEAEIKALVVDEVIKKTMLIRS